MVSNFKDFCNFLGIFFAGRQAFYFVSKFLHFQSKYEPGKRHWLKVKKDYLCGGAMADSADLVVLGAWYGTGNKGMIAMLYRGAVRKIPKMKLSN